MSVAILTAPNVYTGILLEDPDKPLNKIDIAKKILSETDFLKSFSKVNFSWSEYIFKYASEMMALRISKKWVLNFENVPFILLEVLAKKTLESPLFSKTPIIIYTYLCAWKLEKGSIIRTHLDSLKVFEDTGEHIKSKNITLKEVRGKYLMLKSSNFPLDFLPDFFQGKCLAQTFIDSFFATFRSLPDLKSYEWRYEGICICGKSELKHAMKELQKEDFVVELQEPYIKVEYGVVETFQSMSIHMVSAVKIGKLIYEGSGSPTSKGLKTRSKLTVENVIEEISEQLELVAKQGSLVSRYAYNIKSLDEAQQNELKFELSVLGYEAKLDERQFIDVEDNVLKKYVYIYLPFASTLDTKSATPKHSENEFKENHPGVEL